MEILTFALVAGFKIYTPEKRFVPMHFLLAANSVETHTS